MENLINKFIIDLKTFSPADIKLIAEYLNISDVDPIRTIAKYQAEHYSKKSTLGSGINSDMQYFTEQEIKRALGVTTLVGADLSNVSMDGADLENVDLSNANLSNSSLQGANLSGAILSGANLSDSHLGGIKLIGAKLIRSNLTGADLGGD